MDDVPPEYNYLPNYDYPPLEESLGDERVEPICRKFLHVRYEILPYIYNLAALAHKNGSPLMRPLWFNYPSEARADIGDEFMLGDSLLIAPVTTKGCDARDVYLPTGTWYDYWNHTQYIGGKSYRIKAMLDEIPVFVPAGGIIAKAPVVSYVDVLPRTDFEELYIEIYKGVDGKYNLYEDDGISMEYQKGICTQTFIKYDSLTGEVKINGTSKMFPGKKRDIKVILLPEGEVRNITVEYT